MVEGDKIEAKYKDGILCVTLPKKEEAKRTISKPREISIA
jgi:HSP20 family protein